MNSGDIFKVFSVASGTSVTAQKMLLNKVSCLIKWLLNCHDNARTQRILCIFLVTLFGFSRKGYYYEFNTHGILCRPGSPFFMEYVKLDVTCLQLIAI